KDHVHMREVFVLGRGFCAVLAFVVLFACSGGHAQPRIKPAQPGVWPVFPSGDARTVRVSDSYGYLGLGRDSLAVIDMSDPVRPTLTGSATGAGPVLGLDLAGNYAYVAASSNGLHVFDLSSPTRPSLISSYSFAGFATDVQVSGDYAFVAVTDLGLAAIDISNPTHPVRADTWLISGGVRKVHVVSNLAYVVVDGRLEIVNVSDPTHLALAGTYKPPLEHSVNDLNIVGRYAFVAAGSGLDILDLVDPARPVLAASVPIDIWR